MLDSDKSNYMIFTRRYGSLCTRLNLDSNILEKVSATKFLGVWISEDLDWELNTSELCKKAYSRIYLVRKSKYVLVSTQGLLKTFISFILSLLDGVCLCGLTLHTDGQPDLRTRKVQKKPALG